MSQSEILEDFGQYLPKYLSASGAEDLFRELKQFPQNIDQRIFTSVLASEHVLFQGDGLSGMPISHFPDSATKYQSVIVLSNTCDISAGNKRFTPARMVYCPLISFTAYSRLAANHSTIPAAHLKDIRDQRVSSMFFLPKCGALVEDAIALLDHANNCAASYLKPQQIPEKRLFTLSDYGFYLFLFKLSIHFTRIREGVRRTEF